MSHMLRALENVYQDDDSGCWYAEYRLNRNERWERLGVYTSRCAAVAALVRAR
jgi:hypothetical protein